MDCTPESPMPENRDQMGQIWTHHDCTELEDLDDYGIKYKCNSCGLVFIAAVYAM